MSFRRYRFEGSASEASVTRMTAIWRKSEDEWCPLLPTDYPSEEALHDLVEEAPNLLPLSGAPTLTVLGREVAIGPGYADLVAVEADGRLTIIEIKLKKTTGWVALGPTPRRWREKVIVLCPREFTE